MKVLQFTIPVQENKTILSRIDRLAYFYPHLHRHKEVQITWIQNGDGTLVVNNHMHPFKENCIFFIGANQAHILKSDSKYFENPIASPCISLDIFFDPDAVNKYLIAIPELKRLKTFITKSQNGFQVPAPYFVEVSHQMYMIKNCTNEVERILLFLKLIDTLSLIPQTEPLSSQVSLVDNDSEGLRISHIYNYILQNFDRDVALEEIAKEACMTPQAFCRFFKKHTRVTFVAFLNEIRVNEACKMFLEGEFQSVSDVAYKCGFNSITNFNRVFKSLKNLSPKDFIENYRKNISVKIPNSNLIEEN